jgi:hypothetical protein
MELPSTYGRATGARFNSSKSEVFAVDSWNTSEGVTVIPYHQAITILGVRFVSTVARSSHLTWIMAAAKSKALARDTYCRDLCLKQGIQYAHDMSQIWHADVRNSFCPMAIPPYIMAIPRTLKWSTLKIRWHTRRDQTSSFCKTDESM